MRAQLVILFRSTTNGDYSVTQHVVECDWADVDAIKAQVQSQATGRTSVEFFTIHLPTKATA